MNGITCEEYLKLKKERGRVEDRSLVQINNIKGGKN